MPSGKKMTTEEFIARAKEIHGDKYDYSKVIYEFAVKKVCIVCSEHGEFWQTPSSHLGGCGCPKCKKTKKKMTTEEYIAKAREVHGNKYDYTKVTYKGWEDKVCIICPEHGEFFQRAGGHLNGKGCPKCNVEVTNTDEFISKAKKMFGDKYDYSKVNYVNATQKVCIICPEHGEFWISPVGHLKSTCGCPKCSRILAKKKLTGTTEGFIAKAKSIHGDKYDYSKVEYVDSKTDVCIICPEHGEFWQNPQVHLNGHGCPTCTQPNRNMTTEKFIAKAREVHGDKYDYSKVEYINTKTDVCIICPEHGEFWQSPDAHLRGAGCAICNRGYSKDYKYNLLEEFKSEYEFRAFLENNDINILQVILRNVEPKYEPLKRDIERVLANSDDVNPIDYLEQKYSAESEEDENEGENEIVDKEPTIEAVINNVDLDDDDAVTSVLTLVDESKKSEETTTVVEPTIEQVIENTNKELKVINRIEHMLTPEDREYIMNKFLNDKRREWMAKRAV